jgi:hypothetical protein
MIRANSGHCWLNEIFQMLVNIVFRDTILILEQPPSFGLKIQEISMWLVHLKRVKLINIIYYTLYLKESRMDTMQRILGDICNIPTPEDCSNMDRRLQAGIGQVNSCSLVFNNIKIRYFLNYTYWICSSQANGFQ